MTQLFAYQQAGARFLATAPTKGRLLADEPGLGKTAQAIAACDDLCGGHGNVAVVAPASVRENWHREFDRFSRFRHRVLVESYDKVARGEWNNINEVDVLILDEAHMLKTRTAKRTKAILDPGGLAGRADHVLLLTGTPTPNHPAELWPALHALAPETILGKNGKPLPYHAFVSKFCKTRDNGFGVEITGGKNMPELRERIAPFVLRRRAKDVLTDLPPIRFGELPLSGGLTLPPEIAALVPEVDEAIKRDGVEGLKKLATGSLRRHTGLAKVRPMNEWIVDQINGGLRKLVVFAHHTDVLEGMAAGAKQAGILSAYIDGRTKERQAQVDWFQRGPAEVIFLQDQSCREGLDLTAASNLVIAEPDYVDDYNRQMALRIYRITQTMPCLVWVAMLAGTIDERIVRTATRKLLTNKELWGAEELC